MLLDIVQLYCKMSAQGQQTSFLVRGLCGLQNRGNTCYMNAALQALCCTDMLVAYLTHPASSVKDHIKNKILDNMVVAEEKRLGRPIDNISLSSPDIIDRKMKETVTYAIRTLFKYMWSENSEIQPIKFLGTIRKQLPAFANTGQQDSHDVIVAFLNAIHNDTATSGSFEYPANIAPIAHQIDKLEEARINDPEKMVYVQAQLELMRTHNFEQYFIAEAYRYLKQSFKREYSVINEIFTSIYLRCTKCTGCNYESYTFDQDNTMHISFPENYAEPTIELTDMIKREFDYENLTGDNQVVCSNCKEKRDAIRKNSIFFAPHILIVDIKKYKKNEQFPRIMEKINVKVNYHHQLDLSAYMLQHKQALYELYAAVRHDGPYGGGHYYAFCKSPINDNWFVFNDTKVDHLPDGNPYSPEILRSNSYLLFYKLKET